MISFEYVDLPSHCGNSVIYDGAEPAWLYEQARFADEPEIRKYAAAGLMRALLEIQIEEREPATYLDAIGWVRDVILAVQTGKTPTEAEGDVGSFMKTLPPVHGHLDSVSVMATSVNEPHITAAIIDKYIPREAGKLVIGIGQGGILSSLATYSALSGDNAFYPIHYSAHKSNHSKPVLADCERRFIREIADGRTLVVHDEDRSVQKYVGTVSSMMTYLHRELGLTSIGITPVLAKCPQKLWPQVTRISPSGDIGDCMHDDFSPESPEMKVIRAKLAAASRQTA